STVIVGTVIDQSLQDSLRVTIVATGLGTVQAKGQVRPVSIVKTGTDNLAVENYSSLDLPTVMRTGRKRESEVEAMKQSGMEMLDIPAFLRKQAD
ncbi:MAG: cell division protein FtsZ, partial [Burkholderiales bacterium]|nr:cell division protein FtsZ [Burkholderiales bacterium]